MHANMHLAPPRLVEGRRVPLGGAPLAPPSGGGGESGQTRVALGARATPGDRAGEGRAGDLGSGPGCGRAMRSRVEPPSRRCSPALGGGAGRGAGARLPPASRLPPPAPGGSGGARCKQSGGRDVSRSHGASYGSGWLSAGGQLRQLLLWLGRRRRGGGRGGSGVGPSALPALSAPRLK